MSRHQAREEAFKILFQLEMNDQQPAREEAFLEDNYIQKLLEGIKQEKTNIDQRITEQLKNWTFSRIALVDKIILRIAIYEIMHMDDIPQAVSINEAVNLAHKYGDDKASKFINGVLSQIHS
ncbi:MAG TPA: transcription antitermination factor NusB [Pseudogracilibacillus sp.]|nr:transcription antitermination factor NusB [Pseudogracilibacillus sp.]